LGGARVKRENDKIDVCAIFAVHSGGTVTVGSKVEKHFVREESELISDWLLNGSIQWASLRLNGADLPSVAIGGKTGEMR
jgi:hypothetical protein